jgi:hypothetical protein
MSLLPAGKTFSSPNNPLFATQAELAEVVSNLSTVNVTSGVGSGIDVTEPSINNFNLALNLSNAGGISFLTYPSVTTVGLSNAGVVSLSAGSGIGVSGATGAVTVSNTGVNALTAGTNITLGGTATNPIVNATVALAPNVIIDQWTSSPSNTSSVGGSTTVAQTISGLTTGKTYLVVLNGGLAGGSGGGGMLATINFPGIGESMILADQPNSPTTFGLSCSACVRIPVGYTAFNIEVSGSGVGGDTISLRIDNLVVTPLN